MQGCKVRLVSSIRITAVYIENHTVVTMNEYAVLRKLVHFNSYKLFEEMYVLQITEVAFERKVGGGGLLLK